MAGCGGREGTTREVPLCSGSPRNWLVEILRGVKPSDIPIEQPHNYLGLDVYSAGLMGKYIHLSRPYQFSTDRIPHQIGGR